MKNKQLEFDGIKGWGGRRPGAGRPASGLVNHMKRPAITLKTPLHITLRLKDKLPNLRRKYFFKEFKTSVRHAKAQGLYIIHFSIQSNHIHLFAEAKSQRALSLGMRALAGRFAKFVRQSAYLLGASKKGSVFKGRYHLHCLITPHETKNALEYVLLNISKHQNLIEYMDHFSSGPIFRDWKKLLGKRFSSLIRSDGEFWKRQVGDRTEFKEILSTPRSWLAQKGWMRACT